MEIQDLKIGTWNMRSLYRTETLITVVSEIDKYELAILAIQETRWPGSGNHKTEKATLFYSGGLGHIRGVDFLVSDRILNNIKRFEPINDRLCLLKIQAKWFNIILINCYAPTEDEDEKTKNDFYKQLEALYDTKPQNLVKVVLGDFIVKIGKEICYRPTIGQQSLHNNSNDNGVRVIYFATSKGMAISSTFFPHKQIHKQTWMSPSGTTKNQIDHIMIESRRKHCITNVKSCRDVYGISDHLLIRNQVHLRLSVKWREKKRVTQKFNVKKLKENTNLQNYIETINRNLKNGKAPEKYNNRVTKIEWENCNKKARTNYYKSMEGRRNTRSLEFVDPILYIQKRGYYELQQL
ncbi:craniofacial development protein 2-like [Sipha flava]|uniref:Craniofacial development protein 2-like n=1 Tax=Sipha flava TaxID=143950 RepID=A0A8B8FBC5_9HEMI|nr:craniofacial development protein 2-like [Sipha flava]